MVEETDCVQKIFFVFSLSWIVQFTLVCSIIAAHVIFKIAADAVVLVET